MMYNISFFRTSGEMLYNISFFRTSGEMMYIISPSSQHFPPAVYSTLPSTSAAPTSGQKTRTTGSGFTPGPAFPLLDLSLVKPMTESCVNTPEPTPTKQSRFLKLISKKLFDVWFCVNYYSANFTRKLWFPRQNMLSHLSWQTPISGKLREF